jgi:hypothetical protein
VNPELLQAAIQRYAGIITGRRPAAEVGRAQLEGLEAMRDAGSLTTAEFTELRARVIAAPAG